MFYIFPFLSLQTATLLIAGLEKRRTKSGAAEERRGGGGEELLDGRESAHGLRRPEEEDRGRTKAAAPLSHASRFRSGVGRMRRSCRGNRAAGLAKQGRSAGRARAGEGLGLRGRQRSEGRRERPSE